MKKLISIFVSILLVGSICACKKNEEVAEPAPQKDAQTIISEKLSSMSMDEKIYQMFFVPPEAFGVETHTDGGKTEEAILAKPVGGIILFGNNIKNKKQLTSLTEELQSYSKVPLFIGIDEEGGDVARIGNNDDMGTEKFPPASEMGSEEDVFEAYKTIGAEIREFGINVNFAPVADVLVNENNTEIGNRSFGKNVDDVAKKTASAVAGLHEGGVASVLKHFPSGASTVSDSHKGKSASERTIEELRECELKPFIAGIEKGTEFVMVSHASFSNITGPDIPSTLAYKIMRDLLRSEAGFEGIVITDSFTMKAITNYYSPGSAAVTAIIAGADMILMPENLSDAVEGIKGAVASGRITEERINKSVERILMAKYKMGLL